MRGRRNVLGQCDQGQIQCALTHLLLKMMAQLAHDIQFERFESVVYVV